jgi:N-acetylmuramoyl-L-alanine amidase
LRPPRRLAPRFGAALVLLGLAATAARADAPSCLIAIDIGHTRQAPGATSARGVPEWRFNEALAARIPAALAAHGLAAILLNPTGDPISLSDRPAAAKAAGASLLISIHHDSVQPQYLSHWDDAGQTRSYSDRFSGYGLFVSALNPGFAESRRVAADIADRLLAAGLRPSLHHAEPIQGENRPLLDSARGIYQFDGLVVLKQAAMPALLIEAGIIVNRQDEPVLQTAEYQDKIIDALIAGAAGHCARLVALAPAP